MKTALVVDSASPSVPDLAADLAAVGIRVVGTSSRDNLVREAIRLGPDLIVGHEPSVDEALFEACGRLLSTAPHPVVIFTGDPDVPKMTRALQVGIHGYVVNGYGLNRMRSVLQLAIARFDHERGLRAELAEITRRFDERKLVDRAKGILMRARQVSEEEAFRALRTASMHSNRRVGQVSQQVIDAAHYADAVNRAGKLRMLAQRLVKLCVLQALAPRAVGSSNPASPATSVSASASAAASAPTSARTSLPTAASTRAPASPTTTTLGSTTAQLIADSITQLDATIAALGRSLSKATFGDLLEAVEAAWPALRGQVAAAAAAPQALAAEALLELDRAAGALLQHADQLTRHLETAGLVTTLHVINVSGRQRMWSQRHAKAALLSLVFSGEVERQARAELAQATAAFEQGLDYLRTIPLTTREIRELLDAAGRAWDALQQAERQLHGPAGLPALAESSETLLDCFERLTDQYERSMQVLMG